MDLRFHGPFPPRVEEGTPGTITAKPKPEDQTKQQEDEDEPICLLQAWSEPREGGKIAYLFLMYGLQVPPWEVAEKIVRYFRLTPTKENMHTFIECIPPNQELLKPVYTRYNFHWEWKKAKWVQRGANWIWQSSGHGIVFPYSESAITMEEETLYELQLTALMTEAEQDAKIALPQPKQTLLIPTFSRNGRTNSTEQLAIGEKATSTNSTL